MSTRTAAIQRANRRLLSALKSLDERTSFVAQGARHGVMLRRIRAFERAFGVELPDDFVNASLGPRGGLYVEVDEARWPEIEAGQRGPAWTFERALWLFGFDASAPAWMNIEQATRELSEQAKATFVPFLAVETNPDWYCFDAHGVVHRWDSEAGECDELEGGFFEWFEHECVELQDRNERIGALRRGRAR